ncbi:MAG: hypothetical protein ACYSX0_09115 [Planctomycetota bacterium]
MVRSPELGIDAPERLPDPSVATPPVAPDSAGLVLVANRGTSRLTVGEATAVDLERLFGGPMEGVAATGSREYSVRQGLTFHLKAHGKLNTVLTRPGFAGRTTKGARHGDPRWRIMELYGVPVDQKADASVWSYPGVTFWFDGFQRVARIVISRR